MLNPEDFTRPERQYDGDEIDLDAAIEYFLDRKFPEKISRMCGGLNELMYRSEKGGYSPPLLSAFVR